MIMGFFSKLFEPKYQTNPEFRALHYRYIKITDISIIPLGQLYTVEKNTGGVCVINLSEKFIGQYDEIKKIFKNEAHYIVSKHVSELLVYDKEDYLWDKSIIFNKIRMIPLTYNPPK